VGYSIKWKIQSNIYNKSTLIFHSTFCYYEARECAILSLLFISFWEGYGVLEIAGELRGNHNIHYFGMLPIAINGSWRGFGVFILLGCDVVPHPVRIQTPTAPLCKPKNLHGGDSFDTG
jgi:hypothetical protein